jgi:hypothetical protein
MDFYSIFVVEDPSGEGIGLGQAEYEWAEAYALHYAADSDVAGG